MVAELVDPLMNYLNSSNIILNKDYLGKHLKHLSYLYRQIRDIKISMKHSSTRDFISSVIEWNLKKKLSIDFETITKIGKQIDEELMNEKLITDVLEDKLRTMDLNDAKSLMMLYDFIRPLLPIVKSSEIWRSVFKTSFPILLKNKLNQVMSKWKLDYSVSRVIELIDKFASDTSLAESDINVIDLILFEIIEYQISRRLDWTQFLFYFKDTNHYKNLSQTENSDPNNLEYTASEPTTVENILNSEQNNPSQRLKTNILSKFIQSYFDLTYKKIKHILGPRPIKTHWMLPFEDFPRKNEAMLKFMGENREKVTLTDPKKVNRIQLCKVAQQYELLTNLKDIQKDGHKYKTVVLSKIYNNRGYYNKKLKLLNEFAHHFGLEFINYENDCELGDVKPGTLLASISENRSKHRSGFSGAQKRLKSDFDRSSDESFEREDKMTRR